MKVKHVLMIAAVLLAMLVVPAAADESADTPVSLTSAAEYYIVIPPSGVNLDTGTATAKPGIQMTKCAPGSLIELSLASGDDGFYLVHTFDSQYILNYDVTADGKDVVSGDLILDADAGVMAEQNVTLGFTADIMNLPAAGLYKDTLTFIAKERVPIDGKQAELVSTLPDLLQAAGAGEYVVLTTDLVGPADLSSGYGTTGFVLNGAILDGNGKTLEAVNAGTTWDSVVNVKGDGGTIKDVTVKNGFRGIFLSHLNPNAEIILDGVTFKDVVYTVHVDSAAEGSTLTVKNSYLYGWTSYASTLSSASFTDCYFGEGSGYAFSRPYAPTLYDGCNFEAGFEMDLRAACTFTDCYLDGVLIDATNIGNLVTYNPEMATVMNS